MTTIQRKTPPSRTLDEGALLSESDQGFVNNSKLPLPWVARTRQR